MLRRGTGPEIEPDGPRSEESIDRRAPFRWGVLVGLAVGLIVAIAAAFLVGQNDQRVRFEWLTFDFRAPLWLMLAASLAAGAVIAEAANVFVHLRRSRRAR